MREHVDGPTNDEQPYSKSIATRGVESIKCLEDSWQMLLCDTDASIVHVDPHLITRTSASDQNASARLRIFDGIAYEIPEDNVEQKRIAYYGSPCWTHLDADVPI